MVARINMEIEGMHPSPCSGFQKQLAGETLCLLCVRFPNALKPSFDKCKDSGIAEWSLFCNTPGFSAQTENSHSS